MQAKESLIYFHSALRTVLKKILPLSQCVYALQYQMLINFHLSINVPWRHDDKTHRWEWKEHGLSEMKNVYVAKVTKLSHKKCMIWHSLINVSKMQLLSCLCCKFHFPVMTSQIPPLNACLIYFSLQNELNQRILAQPVSVSLSMRNKSLLYSRRLCWMIIAHEPSLLMIPKSQNCWWQVILEVL